MLYAFLLEIHRAHWHSKDTKETCLTLYNLAFPKLVSHGAIILGFVFYFQFLTSFKTLYIQNNFRKYWFGELRHKQD